MIRSIDKLAMEWRNTGVPDISVIRRIESRLEGIDEVTEGALAVRKMISGLHLCHVDFSTHIRAVLGSIGSLTPLVPPDSIGCYSISREAGSHSPGLLRNIGKTDEWVKTLEERMSLPQMGVSKEESDSALPILLSDSENPKVLQGTGGRVGMAADRDAESKSRILLKAAVLRLKGHPSFHNIEAGGKIERMFMRQACGVAPCHYSFQENIKSFLESVERMEPRTAFETCGTYPKEVYGEVCVVVRALKRYLETEITETGDGISREGNVGSGEAALGSMENAILRLLGDPSSEKLWLADCLYQTLMMLSHPSMAKKNVNSIRMSFMRATGSHLRQGRFL
ncbi:MAG: hypothetical protein J7L61_02060 [Thermoplasmata archaeon]|nr:hypothetical protein [Thermoplasmata archaeon]